MNKAKMVFNQTLMISTGILFGLGVQCLIGHLVSDAEYLSWPWYIPLSIILCGLLCSLPSILLVDEDGEVIRGLKVKVVIHFFCILGVVSLCGWIFKWYTQWRYYIPILIMYVLIYSFVWIASIWMSKSDEKKINDAIKDIQDEE